MSQDEVINWSYMQPSSLWEDCDQSGVSSAKSVFQLGGSRFNQVSLVTIYLDHEDNNLFSIEYYKKRLAGGFHYDGLRESFDTIELALFSTSLRVKERFNIEVSYSKALREYYEYREEESKGNNK